jgi:drug/metabolite transporter (DMT)-like permease
MLGIDWKKLGPLAVCFLVTSIFSLHYIAAKEVLNADVSPYSLSAWRGIIGGGIILLYFRRLWGSSELVGRWGMVFLTAFLGFFVNQIFFMKGLKLTTPTSTSLISNTIPVMTFALALTLRIERFDLRKFAGVVISFVLICILIIQDKAAEAEFFNLGNLFIFLNVIAFSLSFVLGKKILNKDFPFQLLTGFILFFGGGMMSLVAGEELFDLVHYSTQSSKALGLVLFEILISTSFVYFLNIWTLKKLEATTVTFFVYFQPIITSLGELLVFQQVPEMYKIWVFLGIVLGGILVVKRKILPTRKFN